MTKREIAEKYVNEFNNHDNDVEDVVNRLTLLEEDNNGVCVDIHYRKWMKEYYLIVECDDRHQIWKFDRIEELFEQEYPEEVFKPETKERTVYEEEVRNKIDYERRNSSMLASGYNDNHLSEVSYGVLKNLDKLFHMLGVGTETTGWEDIKDEDKSSLLKVYSLLKQMYDLIDDEEQERGYSGAIELYNETGVWLDYYGPRK